MISPRRRGGRPCGVSLVWAQPCDALCRHSPDCLAPEKPDCCGHRLAERQGRPKGAVALDPQDLDAEEGHAPQASSPSRQARAPAGERELCPETLKIAIGCVNCCARPAAAFPSSIASSPTPDARVEYGEDDRRHAMLDDGHRPALRPPAFRAKAPDRRPEPRADEPQSTSQAPYRTLRQHRRLHAPCLELHDPQPWRRP